MNTWQQLQQIAYLIESRTWAGSGDTVFSKAEITAMGAEEVIGDFPTPFVVIRAAGAENDSESPDVLSVSYEVEVCVRVAGGLHGREALVGGVRTNTTAGSEGRGLHEVEEELFAAVGTLTGADGLRAECVPASAARDSLIEGTSYGLRTYTLRATATRARYYHPIAQFTATANGSDVDLAWNNPATRWDTYKVVIRRAATTPPTSPSGGTNLTLASNTPTTHTDTAPGGGTWGYAAFMAYDEKIGPKGSGDSADTEMRYSAQGEHQDTGTATV